MGGSAPVGEGDAQGAGGVWIPSIASAAALLVLGGVLWTPLLALGGVLAASGACALAFARRPSPALRRVAVVIPLWLLLAVAGAWWLRSTHGRGLAFVLAVFFGAPLPLLPWLYARTFATPDK